MKRENCLATLRNVITFAFLGFAAACGGGGGGSDADTTAPNAPVISSPEDGSQTFNRRPEISGTAESNSTVQLFDTGGTTSLGSTKANAAGNWTITSSSLATGVHSLSVKASDAAGNTSTASPLLRLTVLAIPTVGSLYPSNGANWNDYVRASDTATACDGTEPGGYSACLHGGEMRAVEITGYTSCTGLTAVDALDAFDWSCDDSTDPVRMVSSGLKDLAPLTGTTTDSAANQLIDTGASFVTEGVAAGDTLMNTTDYTMTTVLSVTSETQLLTADDIFVTGENYSISVVKSLADLIDFTTAGWKNNSVTVSEGATVLFTTTPGVWWNNSVLTSSGGSLTDMGSDGVGEIYIVTSNPSALFSIDADKIALLIQPGIVVTGTGSTGEDLISATSLNFLWLEGAVDATGDNTGVYLDMLKFSVLRDFKASNADTGSQQNGIYLVNADNNKLADVTVSGNLREGLHLAGSGYNFVSSVIADRNGIAGIAVDFSSNNTLSNLIASNSTLYGLAASFSSSNSFSNIMAVNNSQTNVTIWTSTGNNLTNILATNSGTEGIRLAGNSDNNTLSNIIADNNTSQGISLDASSNNTLSDITANSNAVGIFLSNISDFNELTNVTTINNDDTGIQLNNASSNILTNVTSLSHLDTGISINNSNENQLLNITSSDNGYSGIYLLTSSNNSLSNVTASNNDTAGVYLNSASNNNSLSNVSAANSIDGDGVYLNNSSNNSLSAVSVSNNIWEGIFLSNASNNNSLSNIVAANNNHNGVYLSGSVNTKLANIIATNNTNGVVVYNYSDNTKLLNITASNNVETGVYVDVFSNDNSLTNITAANNGYMGVWLTNSDNNSVSNVTTVNNQSFGFVLATSSNNSLSNIVATDNGDRGVSIGNSSNNYFTGLLKVGNNFVDCSVSGGTNPGLVHSTCANNGSSDATLTPGVTLASSFVAKLTSDDAANTSDSSGTADYPADPATFDWTAFGNNYRGWGVDGDAFPDVGASNRSRWTSGQGRIWDWSLDSGDTVIRAVLADPDDADPIPDGNDTITHTWSGASTVTYLRNASEIMGDAIGNDNGLCEMNETCLFTPNIGSYQGHGPLQSAGSFTDGTLSGVTLMEYGTNGN